MNPRTACLVAAAALVACSLIAHAGIVEAEYFVGPDPGAGQGIALTAASSTNAIASDVESASIDLAGLAPGTHDVGVRAKDTEGRWSSPLIRRITVHPSSFSVPDPEPVASNSGNGIVAAEYFVGPDPGAGSGTTVEVSAAGASAAVDEARPLANTTSPGVHDIGLRVKDGAGRWSSPFIRRTRVLSRDLVLATLSNLPTESSVPSQPPLRQTFLIGVPDLIVPGEVVRIGASGAGVEVTTGPSESAGEFIARLAEAINSDEILAQIITASTDGSGLRVTAAQPGLHPVSWLETSTNLATRIGQEGTIGSEGRRIVAAEYFVGGEPEPGTGTPFEFVGTNSSAGAWEALAAPTARIANGTSKVGIRFKNAAGQWGNAVLRGVTMYSSNFTVAPPASGTNTATNRLIAAEYFVGSDPGPGRATDLGLVEDGLTAAADAVNPLTGTAAPGTFTVGLRFRDSAGRWGNPLLRRTTVQPAAAVANTLANLPPGNTIPPEPASPQVHRLDLAGAFRCGQTFSVTIGGKTLEVPARPFETAANFLQRLSQAINSDPVTTALVEAALAGNTAILLTSRDDGWRPDDWVEASEGLRASLLTRGSIGSDGRKIVAAEYFVGLTPDEGTGTPIPLNAINANAVDFGDTKLPIATYRGGAHAVGVRFKNAAGQWGQPVIKGFTSYVLFGSPDTDAPVITLNGEPAMSVPYGPPFTDPGATASDDIDGDLTSALVVRGSVNTSIPGDYRLHYWSEDLAGNRTSLTRTVSVVDDTQPVFEGAQDVVHTTPPATVDLFAGLRAVDAQFGDLSYRIKLVSNNVDWFTAGTYSARFEVRDPAGNISILDRSITLGPEAVFYPGFQTWMADRGALAAANESQMLPHADPDGDGRSNLLEWQADTDPFNRWSVLAAEFAKASGGYRLTWAALQRITYTLEQSTDMTTWLPMGDPISYGESCILDADIPVSSDRRMFYRVKAAPKQPLLELPTP